jgi:hypothetical protein
MCDEPNAAMTPAPKRWFRFSLRTLFVVVTVIACWLGYEFNWIRERHAFVAQQRTLVEAWSLYTESVWHPNDCAAPGLLQLFGEEGHSMLLIWVDSRDVDDFPAADANRIRRARQLFPEARIQVFNADGATSWSWPYGGDAATVLSHRKLQVEAEDRP